MNSERLREELEARVKKGGKSHNSAAAALRLRLASPGYVQAAHSGRPEAMVKVASYGRGYQACKMMEYIGRIGKDQEIELVDHLGETHQGVEAINLLYEKWAMDFERAKPGTKRPPRDVTHIVLSAAADNTPDNLKRVMLAAQEVAREQFAEKGYECLMGLHQDADKPHVHLLVKNYHRHGDKKLKLNPADLFVIRDRFAQELRAVGLDHVSTLQRDRPKDAAAIRAEVESGIRKLREKENWLRIQLEKKAPDVDALKHRQAILKTVAHLNEQIKTFTKSKSPERAALMGETREIKRALLRSEPDIQKAIESTVRALAKDAMRYREYINELLNPAPSRSMERLTPEERRSREKHLFGLERRTARDIEDARKAIKESAALPEQKELALDALRQHGRLMKGVSIDKETDKLLDRLAKEVENFGERYRELRHPVSGELPKSAADRLIHRRALEKQAVFIEQHIATAKKSVRLAPVAPKVKEAALKTLQQHQKAMGRAVSRERA